MKGGDVFAVAKDKKKKSILGRIAGKIKNSKIGKKVGAGIEKVKEVFGKIADATKKVVGFVKKVGMKTLKIAKFSIVGFWKASKLVGNGVKFLAKAALKSVLPDSFN